MNANYLHHHPSFKDLLIIVAEERVVDPYLVEKDYWITHSLYGLQKLGLEFELKAVHPYRKLKKLYYLRV